MFAAPPAGGESTVEPFRFSLGPSSRRPSLDPSSTTDLRHAGTAIRLLLRWWGAKCSAIFAFLKYRDSIIPTQSAVSTARITGADYSEQDHQNDTRKRKVNALPGELYLHGNPFQ